ncbi:MAG: hemolysin family protein [Candidatus Omnitrophica bacterium]|nr:hemolysin family protein [Candidatus Omnitrophota bacterium]
MIDYFLFLVFIIFSAFFSASETAIFSLSASRLNRLKEQHPQARLVVKLLKRPTRLLSAIVFGNLLVNIGLTSLVTSLFVSRLGQNGLFLAILVSGLAILFLGEIFPKTFAIYLADKISLRFSPLLAAFSNVFYPVIAAIDSIVHYFSSFIIRKHKRSVLTDEEFKTALLLSRKAGQISEQEEDLISNLLEFKDTQASEILTARIDIKGIDSKFTQSQVLTILKEQKHSKFPVYEGSLDNIVGILYSKDLFLNPDTDYHEFLRKPQLIPESKGIDDILKLFLKTKDRVAIVLDEYGGTQGLITAEDIVEEIFGEIYDEFEKIDKPLEHIGPGLWRVHGKAPIKTVNLELDLELPEEEDTIAGFLLSEMKRIPKVGEQFNFKSARKTINFYIERATVRRIVAIRIEDKTKK